MENKNELVEVTDIFHEKLKLLATPMWTTKDIAFYLSMSRPMALRIKKKVIARYGYSSYGTKYVNRDFILTEVDTSTEKEIRKLKELLDEI